MEKESSWSPGGQGATGEEASLAKQGLLSFVPFQGRPTASSSTSLVPPLHTVLVVW